MPRSGLRQLTRLTRSAYCSWETTRSRASVEKGAPADKAGLLNGDLLLRADGDETATLDELQRALALSGAAEILLDVQRGERMRSLRITLEARRAA